MADIIFYTAAICCGIYFVAAAVYTGLTSKFHLIWLCFAVLFGALGGIAGLQQTGEIQIPLWVKITAGSVSAAAACLFFWTEALIISRGHGKPDPGAKYMIIPGAQVRGREISRPLACRLDTAYAYLKENPGTIVIVSGGQGSGEEIPEARAMKIYLEKKGIEGSRILEEDQSVNTDENIDFSRRFMDSREDSVVVVSNAFHIFRTLEICKNQRLENVQGLGAPSNRIMIPSYYLREALAVIKYKISGQI